MKATIRASDSDDLNPRPLKRLRNTPSNASSLSSLTPSPQKPPALASSHPHADIPKTISFLFRRIPPKTLLFSLPYLILHPVDHPSHIQSLSLARHALRRCLSLPSLEPAEECRAWAGIAEIGMMWLDAGASGTSVGDVEQALTKALVISQKHPSLRLYTPHLTVLSARLAQHHQSNSKFAINTLRRLVNALEVSSSVPGSSSHVPPHVLFGAHLDLIHSLACAAEDEAAAPSSPSTLSGTVASVSLGKCLAAIDGMHAAAAKMDVGMTRDGSSGNILVLFGKVIKLQLLVRHGIWTQVPGVLAEAEAALSAYNPSVTASGGEAEDRGEAPAPHSSPTPSSSAAMHPVPATLRVHLLVLGVLFYTYAGDAQAATARLRDLHILLDTGVLTSKPESKFGDATAGCPGLDGWDEGVVEIPFPTPNPSSSTAPPSSLPLRIRTTPPRVLHAVAFLLSAVAKRDPVGRAPKKGVFAMAGLELRELMGPFGGMRDGPRLAKIKADLIGEVVAINILRSDFPAAQASLDELIAHLRSNDLFESYAARVTLQHAQLAHAQGDLERARTCYEVSAYLAGGDDGRAGAIAGVSIKKGGQTNEWVACAARAGEMWLRVGILRRDAGRGERDRQEDKLEMETLRRQGTLLAKECEGRGAALHAVGEVLRACLCEEFTTAKQYLRRALDLATQAQDNHLRALILALSASHYLHTARDHALTMLGTCGQLAAGLGAAKKGEKPKAGGVGNAPLGLWVGERMAELYLLEGRAEEAAMQERANGKLREVVEGMVMGMRMRGS